MDPSGFTLAPLNAALPIGGPARAGKCEMSRYFASSHWPNRARRLTSTGAEISTCHDGPQPISLAAAISITLSIAPNAEEIEVPRQGRQGRAGWAAARRLETSRARR
jgi:hypothetical protein